MNPLMNDDLISIIEAAKLKGVSRNAVYLAVKDGRLPHVMVVGHYALRRTDVLAWKPRGPKGRQKGLPLNDKTKERISKSQKQRWAQRKKRD